MLCRNCIAEGRDFISPLCIAGFADEPFDGIKEFKSGQGCLCRKETIERRVKKAMESRPGRFTQFRTEWK